VLVVGAGIAGVSIARHLTTAGVQVLVAERHHLAAGASGHNAGFLLTGVVDNYAVAVARHGRAVAAEVWALTAANHDLLLEAAGGPPSGHRRQGAWTLASSAAEAEELRESATLLGEDGFSAGWAEQPEAAPPGCLGGLLTLGDGEVDPVAAVAAIASRLPAGCIAEQLEVVALEPSDGEVRVHCRGAEISAGSVILATNAWMPELAAGVPITPVRGQMVATARLPRAIAPRPAYAARGHRYWRQLAGGEMLAGGCRDRFLDAEVGFDAIPTTPVQRCLDELLGTLGVKAVVTHRWAGTMGFTPDGLPLVGELPGAVGVHLLGGWTGHGMGFAVHAAKLLAEQLRGGPPLPGWLSPARFTGVPAAPHG